MVPRTSFKITSANKPKSYSIKGDSGKANVHYFCGTCGSGLYTELEVMPEQTCVKIGSLDDGGANLPMAIEFYTKDRVKYCTAIKDADQKAAFG